MELPAYATVTATQDPSLVSDLHRRLGLLLLSHNRTPVIGFFALDQVCFLLCLFFFFFFRLPLEHMEVPGPGSESELEL